MPVCFCGQPCRAEIGGERDRRPVEEAEAVNSNQFGDMPDLSTGNAYPEVTTIGTDQEKSAI